MRPFFFSRARYRRRRRPLALAQRGFTLVEMMVVIVIIGVVAGAVVLTMPDSSGGVRREAERFAARLKAMQESAIVNGRSTSVVVDPTGYALATSDNGRWRETDRFAWEQGTRADTGSRPVRATFDATGGADALEVVFHRGEGRATVRVDVDGRVAVQR